MGLHIVSWMRKSHSCRKTPVHLFLILFAWLLLPYFGCQASTISTASLNNTPLCIPEERQALLDFKHAISGDTCGMLASWSDEEDNEDCCLWRHVGCDDGTGHVTSLKLAGRYYSDCYLEGNISSSLLVLKHLQHLDLSENHFSHQIPSFIGSLSSLKSLDLSNAGLQGEIPYQLANLSYLTSLDLSDNIYLYANSLGWLSNLTLLTDINLSVIDLTRAIDWMQSVHSLPHLRALHMDGCGLPQPILTSLSYVNRTSTLRVLTLSRNSLVDSRILLWLNRTCLEYVDLSLNDLITSLSPTIFRNLSYLSYLDLSYNKLQAIIFGEMPALSYLNLANNNFTSLVPSDFQNLSSITYLDLSYNKLQDIILDEWPTLFHLNLAHNELTTLVPTSFQNLNSLSYLDLSSNKLDGQIPQGIERLTSLTSLDLSNNFFSGTIPNGLALLPQLSQLDLSQNKLSGVIPPLLDTLRPLANIDLSYNNLSGPIPPQFANFSSDSFVGNSELCGEPLTVHVGCLDIKAEDNHHHSMWNDKGFYVGFYVSIAAGFYVGFWAFCGTLALNDSWRHRYFQSIERIINWIYVTIAIRVAKFSRSRNHVIN